jgi:seryl-tRNA synthetase
MTEDLHPDKIFARGHLTDAEKLLVAETYIKQLEKEIKKLKTKSGEMQSDLDEAHHTIKQMKQAKEKLPTEEKQAIRKEGYVQDLQSQLKSVTEKNKKLKKDNLELLQRIAKIAT